MSTTAADVMTSPAILVAPYANVAQAASILSKHRISAAPVCRDDGTLLGVISEGDLLGPFRESARLQRDWWLGLVAEGEELSQDFLDYVRRDNHTVDELMTRHVVTADEQTTLPQLAELMTKHGVKRVPILRNGRVLGIVSRADLVTALARAPAMLV